MFLVGFLQQKQKKDPDSNANVNWLRLNSSEFFWFADSNHTNNSKYSIGAKKECTAFIKLQFVSHLILDNSNHCRMLHFIIAK